MTAHPEPLRITFILRYNALTGGARVAATYATALQRRGHQVCVISRTLKPPRLLDRVRDWWTGSKPPETGHLDGRELDHRVIPIERALTDADVPDADVIIANWWGAAEWIMGLSDSKGARVQFVQDFVMPPDRTEKKRAILKLPIAKIAVSNWVADQVAAVTGASPPVVENAVDFAHFNAPLREKQATPTVGFIYSTSSVKGCDITIDAIRSAREHLPDLRVVAFGQGPESAKLPLPTNCEYHACPAQPELARHYAAADLWLVASRSEGFGLPILEAMACRTPVAATPVGVAPQYCPFGGALVPHDDPAALADAVVSICGESASAWRVRSQQAYDRVRAYSWDEACARFEAALRAAASTHLVGASQ